MTATAVGKQKLDYKLERHCIFFPFAKQKAITSETERCPQLVYQEEEYEAA